MNRKLIPIVAAVSAVLLTACAASGKSAPRDSIAGDYLAETTNASWYDYEYGYAASEKDELGYDAGEKTWESTDETAQASVPSDSARKLIKNVSMELETREFDTFRAALEARISGCGGYIQESYQYGGARRSRSAAVTARIPAARLEEFCGGISDIGNLISKSETANDVTTTYYDMASHVKAFRQEYDTLLEILDKCTEVEDVIQVQSRITEVLYRIESYQTQLNNYDNLVSYSTVTLNIREVERETVVEEQSVGERMAEGLARTWDSVWSSAQDFAVALVVNLPYILLAAILVAIPVIAVCRIVRRVRKKYPRE